MIMLVIPPIKRLVKRLPIVTGWPVVLAMPVAVVPLLRVVARAFLAVSGKIVLIFVFVAVVSVCVRLVALFILMALVRPIVNVVVIHRPASSWIVM